MADDLLVGEADDETIFRGVTVMPELGLYKIHCDKIGYVLFCFRLRDQTLSRVVWARVS